MEPERPITCESISAIVRFLPVFEVDAFEAGRWVASGGGFPSCSYSDDVLAFLKALRDAGWVAPFDWQAWQEEAAQYVESPRMLESADLETVRRLLTLIVRKERFCEGFLLGMFEGGTLAALLRRLSHIRDTLPQ